MSRYAKCPGLECQAKVKINERSDGVEEYNFCCLPCFEFTWKSAFSEDSESVPLGGHSGQCWDRQELRYDEPVVEGDFRIHTMSAEKLPGGSGGPAL